MFLVIRYAEGNPMEVASYESETEAINAYQTTELDSGSRKHTWFP